MLVIGIMGIVVVLMAIQFKSIKPEYGIMISVVGCTFIFFLIFTCKSEGDCGNGRKACRHNFC